MIRQFIFWLPIAGDIEQTGVPPRNDSVQPPPDSAGFWKGDLQRAQARSRDSVILNDTLLWGDAMTQVEKGSLSPPMAYDQMGLIPELRVVETAAAFRFGVDQGGEIRACGDLKYSAANQYCATTAFIKRPTWGLIGKMALEVKSTNRPLAFIKTDHEAAYKQFPLGRQHSEYAMVTLRHPMAGAWRAFRPYPYSSGPRPPLYNTTVFLGPYLS